MHLKQLWDLKLWDLSRKSVRAWVDDDAPSMGAALAYYTLFSIALVVSNITPIIGANHCVRRITERP